MASLLLLQTPMVQTYVANRFLEEITPRIDGKITFERIHFKPFSHLVLKNVVIIDNEPIADKDNPESQLIDTLFQAKYLVTDFSLKALRDEERLLFNEVMLRDARLNLVLEQDRLTGANTTNLTRIFRLKKQTKESPDKELFHIKKVKVENMTYTMKNHGRRKSPFRGGINWNDLEVNKINLNADDLRFQAGVMSGQVNRLSFREKSGYICNSMSGQAKVGNGLTHLIDLTIIDPWSVISIPDGKLIYSNVKDFSDYVNKVVMDMHIGNSLIDFETISYFSPQLKENDLRIKTREGRFHGTVTDFTLTDMAFEMEQGGFSAIVTGRIAGIQDAMNTTIEAELNECIFTPEGLSTFITYWMKDGKLDLSKILTDETFHLQSTVNGTFNSMVINPVIESSIGSLSGKDFHIDNILNKEQPIKLSGTIQAKDLDAGKILKTDLLGKTTLTMKAKATLGGKEAPIKAKIDELNIKKLHFYGYDYTNIKGQGTISDKVIDGKLTCMDPNLNFMTEGEYSVSRKKNEDKHYEFTATLGYANLNKLNLDKRGKSIVGFKMEADFTKYKSNYIFGFININNLFLENSAGKQTVDTINITSNNKSAKNEYILTFSAPFAEGNLQGSAPAKEFVKDLLGITTKTQLPALYSDPTFEWNNHYYKFNLELQDTQGILAWAVPGLYIADNTILSGGISNRGDIDVTLNSDLIAYQNQYITDLKLEIPNNKNNIKAISGKLTASKLNLATIEFENNSVEFLINDNHIGAEYKYENASDISKNGDFITDIYFRRDNNGLEIEGQLRPTTLHIKSDTKGWQIDPSYVIINKDGIKSAYAKLTNEKHKQKIHLSGGTSLTKADTLNLELENFDISIINSVLKSDLRIKGDASGNIQLTSPLTKKGILIDLTCFPTKFADHRVGELKLKSEWDETFQKFDISATTSIDGRNPLDIKAKFTPKTNNLEATAKLDKADAGYLSPILKNTFSDVGGEISGEVTADGPIDNLEWSSKNTRIDNGQLRVNYINVLYYVDGGFRFSDRGLFFDDIKGRDEYTGEVGIKGGIKWNNKFQNINYDITLDCKEVEAVNLDETQNPFFYGNVFASGNVTFKGPARDLEMFVEATTVKDGKLNVPVITSGVSGKSNLLKFTEIKVEEKIDPYFQIIEKIKKDKVETPKFTSYLDITAEPGLEAIIWIDKDAGHMLSGQGNGRLRMKADAEKFTIDGTYNITSGKYKFVTLGLLNRDFEIQDGSSITFNGGIPNSDLDIDAVYKTKTSLETLISDSTSVSNRRMVECKIKITDKLQNPRLQFGIEIPDIDPAIKSRVESALNTEDKVQKQFLSLLMSNSFLPDEQSGIVDNSSMLYNNVTGVLSSQVNNILDKLNIPVGVDLKYQPDQKGNDLFGVDVQTHMFNNRVVVNGSVGNKQYSEKAQTDVVGDLDIEIKLNQSGAFRLNLFSHSADSYTNYLDNSQRNGVGLTYQTEFSSFSQFIKNIFMNKDKRQEARLSEENAKADVEKVTIQIE